MSISKAKLMEATVEGKKHKCPKCKKDIRVIGIELKQVKGNKYQLIIKRRCSINCSGSKNQLYKAEKVLKKDEIEEEEEFDEERHKAIMATDRVIMAEVEGEKERKKKGLPEPIFIDVTDRDQEDKEIIEELEEEEEEQSEEMMRNELEHEAQHDEYEEPGDPLEDDQPVKLDF